MKKKQDPKLLRNTFIFLTLALALSSQNLSAQEEIKPSLSAPNPHDNARDASSETIKDSKESIFEAITVLQKEISKEQKKEKEIEADAIEADEDKVLQDSQITCNHLISGNLEAKGDGYANAVCNNAMLICTGYVALQKAIQQKSQSLSPKATRSLLKALKKESRMWRLICEITRNVSANGGLTDSFTQSSAP